MNYSNILNYEINDYIFENKELPYNLDSFSDSAKFNIVINFLSEDKNVFARFMHDSNFHEAVCEYLFYKDKYFDDKERLQKEESLFMSVLTEELFTYLADEYLDKHIENICKTKSLKNFKKGIK